MARSDGGPEKGPEPRGAGTNPTSPTGSTSPPGTGVAVTRDEPGDGPLTRLLADRGFRVYHWPTIRTVPPADPSALDEALSALDRYDWAVFTSPRAAASVRDVQRPPSLDVAAVGESTAGALADAGWVVDLVPETQTGEALVIALSEAGVGDGDRVLFPASAIARDVVPDGLARLGAEVVQVVAYRTEAAPLDRAACRAALETGAVEVLTFTSPSTVRNLAAGLGPELMDLAVRSTRAVAIGPTTAEAVREAGWGEVVVAEPHSLEGVAQRVADLADRDRIQEAH